MSKLEEQLAEHEGFKPFAYQDSLGYWTIGYGRLIDKAKGGGISTSEALYLLRNDIARHSVALIEALPWVVTLDETRRNVLTDMAFNLGIPGLLNFRNTLAAVKRGDYQAAASGMRNSKWAEQVGNRAERLARAMETGTMPKKWW